MEGRCCPLAKRGYSRDGKKGTLQIVYGLLCASDGCPVAIEVFDGNTADPMTLATQVEKLKQRFHLDHVVLVGDRGMITQARITEDIKSAGLDWISSLRAPAIKTLVESGALQSAVRSTRHRLPSPRPEQEEFPDERLVVCRDPDLAAERTRKREELLAATERDLTRIQAAVARKRDPLRGTAAIAIALGKVINKHKMAKHLDLDIADATFSFARQYRRESLPRRATDGVYVIRTSLTAETSATTQKQCAATSPSPWWNAPFAASRPSICTSAAYITEWPIGSGRIVCLCMLAYYLEWHMRQRLAPTPLFDDTDKAVAAATATQRGGDGEALTACCRQADYRPHQGRPSSAQLSLAAGRPRDLGAKRCDNRDHTELLQSTCTPTRPTPIQHKAFAPPRYHPVGR